MCSLLSYNDDNYDPSKEEMEAPKFEINERPQRTKNNSIRLQDCEMVNDNKVTKECDSVHMSNIEPINHQETLMNGSCKKAMK